MLGINIDKPLDQGNSTYSIIDCQMDINKISKVYENYALEFSETPYSKFQRLSFLVGSHPLGNLDTICPKFSGIQSGIKYVRTTENLKFFCLLMRKLLKTLTNNKSLLLLSSWKQD